MGFFGPPKPKRDELAEHLSTTGEQEVISADDLSWGTDRIVVTDFCTLTLSKGKISKKVLHKDVAEVKVMQSQRGMLILIETHKSMRDFMPDDYHRWEYMIQAEVTTPGISQDISGEVARRANL